MKIKKLLAAVLVFALCAAFFAACAKNDEPTTMLPTASEPTTETYESVKMNIGCISGPTGIGMAHPYVHKATKRKPQTNILFP